MSEGVVYTTKEMLEKIDTKVDHIATALIGKADLSALIAINLNIEDHQRRLIDLSSRTQDVEGYAASSKGFGDRINGLERSDAIYQAQSRDRKYLYGAILTLVSVLVAVGGLILAVR